MIGIAKYRVQGLRDPLMVNVMRGLGLDSVPLYEAESPDKAAQKRKIREMGRLRDGKVNARRVAVDDPAAFTEGIKATARDLGADLVGVARLEARFVTIGVALPHETIVCIGVAEDYGAVLDGPAAVEAEAGKAYLACARISTALAAHLRNLGYPALAHHNGGCDIQAIPAMIEAGFGELGRHGSLINPDLGASFRPGFVTTSAPLVPDAPLEFGVRETCERCNLCRNNCPGEAIADEAVTTDGIKRWRVDTARCYPYSRFRDAYCHICVDVCPYIHKENRSNAKRTIYKRYMKARKRAGYRAPAGSVAVA